MSFKPDIAPPAGSSNSGRWFVFQNGRLLVKDSPQGSVIPVSEDLDRCGIILNHKQYIGSLEGQPCYAAEVISSDALPAAGYAFKELRALFTRMSKEIVWVAGRANQLVHWNRTHLYCGACGAPMENKKDERAKVCTQCGLINYPRLSPAVIVAVLNGDEILLARNKRFQIPMYSVLAGFVEPGETLEECIQREVKEEVGISVQQIRYFGSQPWPFPNSLMIGYTAQYGAGEIAVDHVEIMDAGWFRKDNLPQVPPTISIAGQLIDWFVKTH